MEKEYQKIIGTFHNDAEKAQKKLLKNFEKFIVKFAKKNWQKISLEIPQNVAGIIGVNFPDNKVAAYIVPDEVYSFPRDDSEKAYILLGKNGTFLWETITDISGNKTGTHLNLANGFPDFIDRYFRKLYSIKK